MYTLDRTAIILGISRVVAHRAARRGEISTTPSIGIAGLVMPNA
jgi:hypothetical protein